MIEYIYTKTNLLEKPNKYTYTPYLGVNFINMYFESRLRHIERFKLQEENFFKSKTDLYFCFNSKKQFESALDSVFYQIDKSWRLLIDWEENFTLKDDVPASINDEIKVLTSFSMEEEVNTEELLSSLVFSQLNSGSETLVKEWIDRLVQRFEVTKKLYKVYPPGFCKGVGTGSIRLYWLLALLLSLYYAKTTNIKYLSTLLKVSDLLCSLDDDFLMNDVSLQGLILILSVEFLSVKSLSYNIQGVEVE